MERVVVVAVRSTEREDERQGVAGGELILGSTFVLSSTYTTLLHTTTPALLTTTDYDEYSTRLEHLPPTRTTEWSAFARAQD